MISKINYIFVYSAYIWLRKGERKDISVVISAIKDHFGLKRNQKAYISIILPLNYIIESEQTGISSLRSFILNIQMCKDLALLHSWWVGLY